MSDDAPRKALGETLFAQASAAAEALGNPCVSHLHVADPTPSPDRDAEFGLLAIDGGAGLYYAWLGGEQAALPSHRALDAVLGRPAVAIAELVLADDDAARSLGMAAINALTAALFAAAGFRPPAATDSFAGLAPTATDVVGMIGNFPPLVRRARAAGAAVRVVERKTHMLTDEPGLVVSLDPAVLAPCNKIVCTGATLINASLDAMLPYCRGAERLALVGPTVGCFPDALFERGIDVVAGTEVRDGGTACARRAAGQPLGDLARRTAMTAADYPGFEALLFSVRTSAD
ncbi:MAG: Rossmann-like domain-containing protein [Gammaproteobacteria bacterium]